MILVTSRVVLRLSLLASLTLPTLLCGAVSVQIELNFTGSTLHLNSENTPPNANGASGPDHYVEIVNGRYAVYDKINGSVVSSNCDVAFWTGAGISFATHGVISVHQNLHKGDTGARKRHRQRADPN